MPEEQQVAIEPKEKPAPATPQTAEEFMQEIDALVARARSAGLHPIRLIVKYVGRQGMSMLDLALATLEDGGKKK